MTTESQTDSYTMIAESAESLVAEVPIEEANLRIGRLFKGAGVTAIKLSFDTDQHMKEHTAAAPILVQVIEGHIEFTVGGETFQMPQGAIIHVDAKVPHSLTSVGTAHVLLLLCDGAPSTRSRTAKA